VQRQGQSGLTTVELLAALAVLMVLVSVAIPLSRWDDKRRREVELRLELRMMRDAIDEYKKAADQGRIKQQHVDQRGVPSDLGFYPRDLDELVDGVDVAEPASGPGTVTGAVTGTTHKVHYLQSIPVDPFTTEAEWGKRSYQDDWDSTSWGHENVYDVYSLSDGKALNGTYYKDW
jgi:general secretion pathway protein G